MKATEIRAKYPSGSKVIDCFGQKNTIIGSYLQVSEFHAPGTLVLGGVFIFDGKSKKWAEILND